MGSIKYWIAVAATYVLMWFLILGVAYAGEWRDRTTINVWCANQEIIDAIVGLDAQGDLTASNNMAIEAFGKGICIKMPPMTGVPFRPVEQTKYYPSFGGEPAVVIRGFLVKSDGQNGGEVYVLSMLSAIGDFKPKKTRYIEAAAKAEYAPIMARWFCATKADAMEIADSTYTAFTALLIEKIAFSKCGLAPPEYYFGFTPLEQGEERADQDGQKYVLVKGVIFKFHPSGGREVYTSAVVGSVKQRLESGVVIDKTKGWKI